MNAIPGRLLSALLLLAMLVPRAAADDENDPVDIGRLSGAGQDVRKIRIADGIYQFMTMRDSYVRQLNSVVVVNRDDVLVFDTNTRPSSARIVLAEIRKITDKPVRYVVNSHWHPDHWSGNEVYADAFPGLEIIATRDTARFMRNVSSAWPTQFRAELERRQAAIHDSGTPANGKDPSPEERRREEDDLRTFTTFVQEAVSLRRVFPTVTFDESLTLLHGGREFRFLSVTGDAEGTTALYLPNEKVLITGDAVSYPIPYVTPPPTRQARSLRRLAELDTDIIIPGHGPAFHDKTFLNLEIELLESVSRGVQAALRGGAVSLAAVQEAVTAEELRVRFTHDDPDLDARFRSRVRDLVEISIREERDGQRFR